MWKPGQLVTINNEVYRITRNSETKRFVCSVCVSDNNYEEPCCKYGLGRSFSRTRAYFNARECSTKMLKKCYPKRVSKKEEQCIKQAKS